MKKSISLKGIVAVLFALLLVAESFASRNESFANYPV